MKKIILIILACFMACAIFSSCNKDSLYEHNIVGTWQIVKLTVKYENGKVDQYDEDDDVSGYFGAVRLTFYDDGTFSNEGFEFEDPYEDLAFHSRYTYTIENGYLYSMGIPQYRIASLNRNKLVLEMNSTIPALQVVNALIIEAGEPKIESSIAELKRQ